MCVCVPPGTLHNPELVGQALQHILVITVRAKGAKASWVDTSLSLNEFPGARISTVISSRREERVPPPPTPSFPVGIPTANIEMLRPGDKFMGAIGSVHFCVCWNIFLIKEVLTTIVNERGVGSNICALLTRCQARS